MVTAQRGPGPARASAALGVPLVEKPVRADELGAILLRAISS